jgi:hypothetical protein
MKNEEFRKMFTDYAEEISDPENRKVCFDECYKSNLLKYNSLKKAVVHMYNKRPPVGNIFKILLDHGKMGTCHNLSYVISYVIIRSDQVRYFQIQSTVSSYFINYGFSLTSVYDAYDTH